MEEKGESRKYLAFFRLSLFLIVVENRPTIAAEGTSHRLISTAPGKDDETDGRERKLNMCKLS